MDIGQIIHDVQHEHCVQCPVGRCLISLKALVDSQEKQPTDKKSLSVDSRSVNEKQPAAKKSMRKPLISKSKTGNSDSKKCNGCGSTKAIADFPLNKSCADGHTGTCKVCTYARQRQNRVAQKTAITPRPTPPAATEAAAGEPIKCRLCNSPCSDKAAYARHMLKIHGKVVV